MMNSASRRAAMAITLLGCAAPILAACNDLSLDPISLETGDPVTYNALVQPYVGLACGSLDCHGDSGRALRIYAEHGLRSEDDLRDMEISAAEVAANVRSFAAVSPNIVDPANHLALLKALSPSAGGTAHVGGPVWEQPADVGYQCVLAWLSSTADTVEASNDCAAAFAEVELPPET